MILFEKKKIDSLQYLKDFLKLFYSELERILQAIENKDSILKFDIHHKQLYDGLEKFSFKWGNGWIILNPEKHAGIPKAKDLDNFKLKIRHRLIDLYYSDNLDDGPSTAVAEIYVSPNGRWIALGTIGPRYMEIIQNDNIADLAMSLVKSLAYRFVPTFIELEKRELMDTQKSKAQMGFIKPS